MNSITPFVWRRRIGMRDVDAWGLVWYGNYLAFCDEARAELLRSFDLAPGTFVDRGLLAPVIDMGARYHSPARYDEEIDVHVLVSLPKGTRLRFEFEIRRATDQQVLVRIHTTLVLMRVNGDLVYLIPKDIKKHIDRLLCAQGEACDPPLSRGQARRAVEAQSS